jgi:hypothetical protein
LTHCLCPVETRAWSFQEESEWAKSHLLIDDGKIFELTGAAGWLEMLPRLYKHAQRAKKLADRLKRSEERVAAKDVADREAYLSTRTGIACEGYVIKQGGFRHNWKKRWLVLDDNGFRYYQTTDTKVDLLPSYADVPQRLNCRREVAISKVVAAKRIEVPSEVPGKLTDYSFLEIETTEDDDRVFLLCCATPEEAARWEDQFQDVS